MKPADQPKQPNVNDTRALIGLCLLVISNWGQIRDPWDSQVFTKAPMVIALSLHIHSFIHLSFEYNTFTNLKQGDNNHTDIIWYCPLSIH